MEDKAKLRIISQVCNILQELNIQLFLYLIFKVVWFLCLIDWMKALAPIEDSQNEGAAKFLNIFSKKTLKL